MPGTRLKVTACLFATLLVGGLAGLAGPAWSAENAAAPGGGAAAVSAPRGAAAAPAASADAKVRVLLLSGKNNHDWKTTTPALKAIFDASGRFAVDVTDDPAKCDAGTFAKYDVIVSNWTPWPDVKARLWDAATEKAFVDFIAGGKGLVVFHAACTACQSWPEFQQIVGGTWDLAKTGHGARHEFLVVIADKEHPVTAGMKDFRTSDELWHRMGVQPGAKTLCTAFSAKDKGGSGQAEPVAMYTLFGKGRGFNLVLGHDAEAMKVPGWRTLMLRGTEWAATGKVTLPVIESAAASPAEVDAAVQAAAAYKFGDSRKPLEALSGVVSDAATDAARAKAVAGKLLAAASGKDIAPEARRFLCRQLSMIATDADVPALAAMLADKDPATALAGRSVLERMPGEPALAAIRDALAKAGPAAGGAGAGDAGAGGGDARLGLVNSLGERRDAKAVAAIAPCLADPNVALAGAAVEALGKIGGPDALKALRDARDKLPAAARPIWPNGMLNCAASLLAAGQTEQAAAVFEELSAPDQPRHIRLAAFPGLVACRKGNSADLVLAALTGKDPSMQVAAVQAARAAAGDAKLAAALIAQLPKAESPLRVMLIELLAAQNAKDALAEVAKQARAEDPAVRQAAIAALGTLGDAGTVGMLVALAAEAKGPERDAARGSLVRLKGTEIDAAMLGLLKKADAPKRVELIVALRERGAAAAVGAITEAAADADPAVRAEAVKALGKLGDAATCPALIALLGKAEGDADRYAVQQAIVAVCRRAARGGASGPGGAGGPSGAKPVLDALRGADAAHAEPLLAVLAALGGADSLDAIRTAAKSPDQAVRTAAIRALADWPDAAPLEELLAMAKAADKPLPRILALRGLAKLAAKAADRKPADLVKLLAAAIALADRPEEKKALLAALGGVADPAALDLAVSHLQTPALAGEAGLAVAKIAAETWKTHPKPTRAALDQVMAAKIAPAVQAEAARILIELSRPRNLALGATASSPDGWQKDGAAGGDQAAIDGNPDTYWDKEDGKDLYRLVVTFKQAEEVAVLRITGYQHHNFAPKDFDVLADGKVVKTVRGAQYDNNHLTVAFPPVRCLAVELKITGYYGGSPAVRELEIYGPTPTTAAAGTTVK